MVSVRRGLSVRRSGRLEPTQLPSIGPKVTDPRQGAQRRCRNLGEATAPWDLWKDGAAAGNDAKMSVGPGAAGARVLRQESKQARRAEGARRGVYVCPGWAWSRTSPRLHVSG